MSELPVQLIWFTTQSVAQTSSMNSTWKCVRNAVLGPPSGPLNEKLHFNQIPDDLGAH